MAPRARPKKVGDRRIDEALDAMRSYGFSQDLVVATVKELLEVYGKDGWPFIEDAAYRVLIDAILEKVEQEVLNESNALQDNEIDGNNAEVSAVGTSSGARVVSTCDIVEAAALTSQSNKPSDSASQTRIVFDTALTDAIVGLPMPEVEGSGWKDKSLDQDCSKKQMNDVKGTADGNLDKLGDPSHSPPRLIISPQHVDCFLPRRRKPCPGWISSDDEEDLVYREPATLPAKRQCCIQRCSRWDARPKDM